MAGVSKKIKTIFIGICFIVFCIFELNEFFQKRIEAEQRDDRSASLLASATHTSRFQSDRPVNDSEDLQAVVYSKEDLKAIEAYMDEQEKICKKMIANKTGINWCPCIPPNLKGRLHRNVVDDSTWEEIEREVGEDVLIGGEWRPPDCVSHTRLAVIIPCRDRDSNLRVMLRHLYPILQRQLVHFRIFISDQNSPVIFNKASTMNIGFLEASKRFDFTCAMFHDVDHLLEDDRTLLKCGPQPHHYAVSMDEWGYRLIYGGLFGGVVSLTKKMFKRVNGYSNKFFGWGGEDDDMGSRVRHFWRVYRPPMQISRYTTIKHPMDSSNPRSDYGHRLTTMREQWANYENETFDGLTDLRYRLVDVQLKNLFTKILSDINVTNLPYMSKYKQSRYIKLSGVCLDRNNVIESKDVSMQTCRYACDKLSHKPCYGFSYQPEGGSSRCSLLTTVCHLSASERGATYVKDEKLFKE